MSDEHRISQEQIYKEYKDKVWRYISGKVQNYHQAEDLTSAVFLKICHSLDGYDPARASLSTWVYTITRNTVTDYYRTVHEHDPLPQEAADTPPLDEGLDELAAALEALPEVQRDTVILHYYSGCTLKEIARRMGMSYANIKIIHSKALKALQQLIQN